MPGGIHGIEIEIVVTFEWSLKTVLLCCHALLSELLVRVFCILVI